MAIQTYDITGVVHKLRILKTGKSIIDVITEFGLIHCKCDFYKPVREGDAIMGVVLPENIQQAMFTFIKPPYACITNDNPYIIKCFHIALKKGDNFNNNLYSMILNAIRINDDLASIPCFGDDKSSEATSKKEISESDKVIDYLTAGAKALCEERSDEYINMLTSKEFNIDHRHIETLFNWWYKKHSLRRLYLLGLTHKEVKACHMSHDRIYEICTGKDGIPANPFRIAAIPMLTAHTICDQLGVIPHPDHLLCGQICRKVRDYCVKNAWTCTPMWMLRKSFPFIQAQVRALEEYYFCVFDMDSAYLEYPYRVEKKIAHVVDKLIKSTAQKANSKRGIEEMPRMFLGKGVVLSEGQIDAIAGSLEHDISIITGGPGTGKSTICNEIVKNLTYNDKPYLIGSFTGKAVSRLNQCLGDNIAKTLDSMIMTVDPDVYYHLIIDEASMVTTELFYRLDKALKKGYKLTIIGDIDQLQPIGWGSFMSQLMACPSVPIFRLMYNFRINGPVDSVKKEGECPKDSSMALINANNLIEKTRSLSKPYKFKEGPGFNLFDGNLSTLKAIIGTYKDIINNHAERDEVDNRITLDDIMVICPYNTHVDEINNIFAEIFHSDDKRSLDHEKKVWNEGGRVMMNNNNYDIKVMNGDEGIITNVDSEGVEVQFEDIIEVKSIKGKLETIKNPNIHKFFYIPKDKSYQEEKEVKEDIPKEEAFEKKLSTEDLNRSYCITVHKAQGSERDYVFVYIPSKIDGSGRVQRFLNINLLYTALTRCRKEVYLIGDMATINVVTSQIQQKRCDNLAIRIKALSDEELEEYLQEEVKKAILKASKEKKEYVEEEDPSPPIHYEDEYDPFYDEEEMDGCFLPADLFM